MLYRVRLGVCAVLAENRAVVLADLVSSTTNEVAAKLRIRGCLVGGKFVFEDSGPSPTTRVFDCS